MTADSAPLPLLLELGGKVRALRQQRALTLRALARQCGLSERFLQGVEAGKANISVVNLAEVARALGVSAGSLLEQENGKGQPARQAPVLALLGLRGAGKSSVGAALAKRLGIPFRELDRLIEQQAGMGVTEIFAIHGEEYFRAVELQALEKVLGSGERLVLATSGGLVTSPEAYALLRERAQTVWLRALPEEHWERVVKQGDLRPIANRPHAMTELRRRLREREPLYRKAGHTCSTSKRSLEEVVSELEYLWSARRGDRSHPATPVSFSRGKPRD